jgi:hypothetical protein
MRNTLGITKLLLYHRTAVWLNYIILKRVCSFDLPFHLGSILSNFTLNFLLTLTATTQIYRNKTHNVNNVQFLQGNFKHCFNNFSELAVLLNLINQLAYFKHKLPCRSSTLSLRCSPVVGIKEN